MLAALLIGTESPVVYGRFPFLGRGGRRPYRDPGRSNLSTHVSVQFQWLLRTVPLVPNTLNNVHMYVSAPNYNQVSKFVPR